MNHSHGMTGTRIYYIYNNMINRCEREKDKRYSNYGKRGISVCDEWKQSFQSFFNWALSNGYDETLTLDRIDVDGNYDPNNCRWTTIKEQENNRSNNHLITFNGKTQTLAQWSEERKIKYATLERRINKYKWTIQKALNF